MQIFTIERGQVECGAQLQRDGVGVRDEYAYLFLGGGSNHTKVRMFRNNVPEIRTLFSWGGSIKEAHPVPVSGGYTLAKPNRDSDQILLVIRTGDGGSGGPVVGDWRFEHCTICHSDQKVLATATGPKDYYTKQKDNPSNVGWRDALVVMSIGDVIRVTDRAGNITRVMYESKEKGVVKM